MSRTERTNIGGYVYHVLNRANSRVIIFDNKGDYQLFEKRLLTPFINVITQTEIFCIVKARLFCKYLKGSSLRIVYAHFEQEQRIEFIELYFKGDKENEDRERIKEYLKNNQN